MRRGIRAVNGAAQRIAPQRVQMSIVSPNWRAFPILDQDGKPSANDPVFARSGQLLSTSGGRLYHDRERRSLADGAPTGSTR